MEALTKAREARGWGFEKAAKKLGISQQALRNLERNSPTRDTNPGNVTVFTFIAILEMFPELDVGDFVAGTTLSVRPPDIGGLTPQECGEV